MLIDALKHIKTAFILLFIFTLLTGILYPATVTGIAQLFFPWQANGSLITNNGNTVGSLLIGQSFTDPRYFWSRPSATTPFPYNAANSSGSNLGPTNPDFLKSIQERVSTLQQAYPQNHQLVPVDLVTASGSGLDPEISPMAALYQVSRIAKVRGISEKDLQLLITKHTSNRFLGIFGESRVNVLALNIDLDNQFKETNTRAGL